jgi:2-oxo-4-hydroxy-4-carboxy-5-ureidoimidazoline decarboxylase
VKLSEFNAATPERARHLLLACCSAPGWVDAVVAGRPYRSRRQLQDAAEAGLTEADAMDGLAGHPRIGESRARLDGRSRSEQGGVLGARAEVLAALAEGNTAYERRFGHVYLVCASGRTADELLTVLRSRLANSAETERAVVRTELAAINRLRLDQLVEAEVAT